MLINYLIAQCHSERNEERMKWRISPPNWNYEIPHRTFRFCWNDRVL